MPRSSTALRLALLLAVGAVVATDLYVDPVKGNDSNAGTAAAPFKTLARAQAAVRALQPLASGVTVNLHGGQYYPSPATAPLLNLTGAADSGTASAPIVYRAVPSDTEPVQLMGGREVPASAWKPYGSAGAVVANLTALGLDNFGSIVGGGGLGTCNNARMELWVNGSAAVLARYPNINASTGYWQWDNIASVVDEQKAFKYSGTRPSNWLSNPAGNPVFLHGYWMYGWADSRVEVASINTTSSTITVAQPPVYGFKATARYYAFNVLAELDAANEYFLDVTQGLLHWMPPAGADLTATRVVVSVVEGAGIVLKDVSFVAVQGVQMQHTQGSAVSATGVTNVTLADCAFDGHAMTGMSLSGTNNSLLRSTFADCGCKGVTVSGGDTATLTNGSNLVQACNITRWSRWTRTYQGGISWSGVGNRYVGNSLVDAPHTALIGGGNNNLFLGNTVRHLAYEVTDSGAWYSGRSWVHRNNHIINNTFEDVRNHVKTFLGAASVQAIYFDDQLSDNVVQGNTFIDCHVGMFVGGGRRHYVANNTFIRSAASATHIDSRGLSWQKSYCTPPNGTFFQELDAVHYKSPPFSTQYPHLPDVANEFPCVPAYNLIVNNQYCNCTFADYTASDLKQWSSIASNNVNTCA